MDKKKKKSKKRLHRETDEVAKGEDKPQEMIKRQKVSDNKETQEKSEAFKSLFHAQY